MKILATLKSAPKNFDFIKKVYVIILKNDEQTLIKVNLKTLNIKFFLFVTVCKKFNFRVSLIVNKNLYILLKVQRMHCICICTVIKSF